MLTRGQTPCEVLKSENMPMKEMLTRGLSPCEVLYGDSPHDTEIILTIWPFSNFSVILHLSNKTTSR